MLTETLVPLLSLTSKKGLVTIASNIYIFAHMLMPVSVFPHQGWHISRRKASLFVCPNSIYQAKILNKRKESRRRLQLKINWRILHTKRILKNANTHHVHRLGKKKIFFHITCTLLGQCRCCSWVSAVRLSVFTFYTLLGGGGWGGRRDYKGRHQLTWDHSAELLFYFVSSNGQALFSVFSRFCSTKTLSILESFSLFSLMYAEAKKLFPSAI